MLPLLSPLLLLLLLPLLLLHTRPGTLLPSCDPHTAKPQGSARPLTSPAPSPAVALGSHFPQCADGAPAGLRAAHPPHLEGGGAGVRHQEEQQQQRLARLLLQLYRLQTLLPALLLPV